MCFFLRTKDL
jgi:hypothetical protein